MLIASAIGLAGCKAETVEVRSQENPCLHQGRVEFEDASTRRIVEVVRADTERLAGGLLRITVTLRNKTGNTLWADIRTSFLDANGRALEQTYWTPTLLNARAVTEYSCTSTGGQAAGYQVIIRKPVRSLGAP